MQREHILDNESKQNNGHIDSVGDFFDKHLERHLFKMKHMVFIGVLGALILAFGLFIVGFYEVFVALISFKEIKLFTIYVLKSADLFLFGMVMIIFSLGAYNLFISKLDNVDTDSGRRAILPEWLQFQEFDELKAIVIKVIVLILAITFLEQIIENSQRFHEVELYNLLIIPIGIMLISYSLKIIESKE